MPASSDEIEPWELRKLWMLNGAHSLLAFLGLLRGHETVADAIGDPELVAAMNEFWDLAVATCRTRPRSSSTLTGVTPMPALPMRAWVTRWRRSPATASTSCASGSCR